MKDFIKNGLKIILLILIIIVIYYYYDNSSNNTKNNNTKVNLSSDLLEIYYLDVGEADSTYIHYKDYNILIDAGNTVDGKNIVKYLKDLGVNHFDYIFATHAHEDHMGGMHWMIYKFKVDHFYMPDHKAEWKSYDNLMKALDEEKVLLEVPTIDQVITLDDLIITILYVGNSEDYNENSIVLKINYKNTSYLFMGDSPSDVEHLILDKDIKSNVLHVGHHGSSDSSSANFLYKVHPEYSIISVGKDNPYNHPHDITISKLNKINSTIFRTDINHTIHLLSDGDNINFEFIETNLNGGDLNTN